MNVVGNLTLVKDHNFSVKANKSNKLKRDVITLDPEITPYVFLLHFYEMRSQEFTFQWQNYKNKKTYMHISQMGQKPNKI